MKLEEFYEEIGATLTRARESEQIPPEAVASALTYAVTGVLFGAGLSQDEVKAQMARTVDDAFRQLQHAISTGHLVRLTPDSDENNN
jgi:hypothetical protein